MIYCAPEFFGALNRWASCKLFGATVALLLGCAADSSEVRVEGNGLWCVVNPATDVFPADSKRMELPEHQIHSVVEKMQKAAQSRIRDHAFLMLSEIEAKSLVNDYDLGFGFGYYYLIRAAGIVADQKVTQGAARSTRFVA